LPASIEHINPDAPAPMMITSVFSVNRGYRLITNSLASTYMSSFSGANAWHNPHKGLGAQTIIFSTNFNESTIPNSFKKLPLCRVDADVRRLVHPTLIQILDYS